MRLSVVVVVVALAAQAAIGATINLDSIFVPKGPGFFDLQRGQTYTLRSTKWLRSRTWRAVGPTDAGDAIVIFTPRGDPREQPAFRVGDGDDAKVLPGITVRGSPWTYAFEALQGSQLFVDGVSFGGGASLFHGQGHIRAVLSDCRQLDPSRNYIVYSGGIPHGVTIAGKSISFDEDRSGYTELRNCVLDKGSLFMAGARFVAFEQVVVSGCRISDTAAQAAPGAVPNAALRVHQGQRFILSDTIVNGPVFIGPLDGGDGGLHDNGARRRFRESERVTFISITQCTFANCDQLDIAPGVLRAVFDRCAMTVAGATIIKAHAAYIGRPASVVTVSDSQMICKGATSRIAPRVFGGSDDMTARMSATGGSLNGRPLP